MQRILRGKLFYILLALLVVALMHFSREAQIGSWLPIDTSLTESQQTSTEWLGQEVSPAILSAAAKTDPLVAVALIVLTIFVFLLRTCDS